MTRAKGGQSQGYTIVETLIFLAVSGVMFLSAAALINGRQGRAEFSNGVRDFESIIQDIANDVSTGYYRSSTGNNETLNCTVNAANNIVLGSDDTNNQGSNRGCVLLGQGMLLNPRIDTDAKSSYSVIPLVGRQFNGDTLTDGFAQNYSQTRIEPAVDAKQTSVIPGRPEVACAFYLASASDSVPEKPCDSTAPRAYLISFMTKLLGNPVDGGSTQVDLLVNQESVGPEADDALVASTLAGYADTPGSAVSPAGGVYICLQSTASQQFGLIKFGGQASRFSTAATIKSGSCR